MTTRPKTISEVAVRSETLADFGRHLRDWLHELRRFSSRAQVVAAIKDEPPALAAKFSKGRIADAWLAAYAEHISRRLGRPAPEWAFDSSRISPDPVFDEDTESVPLRMLAILHAPSAFKRRNIFTPSVDLPLRLRAGRPAKSLEEKRKANAERQRRFRRSRLAELSALRAAVRLPTQSSGKVVLPGGPTAKSRK